MDGNCGWNRGERRLRRPQPRREDDHDHEDDWDRDHKDDRDRDHVHEDDRDHEHDHKHDREDEHEHDHVHPTSARTTADSGRGHRH